ncbi:MAG: tetratricopeptide repeat protein [Candidatus Hydrogenedentes bacterium]|nr:tetratricopeptide repeat protein [Candidatus Hydrogenedentota bacterium]
MLILVTKKENIIIGLIFLGSIILIISGVLGLTIERNLEVEAYPKFEQSPNNNLLTLTNTETDNPPEFEITDELIVEKIPYNPNNPDITIDYYKAFLEKNPNHPETPAILTATGNLYMSKKMDYRTAASYFERVIIEYPNWEGAKGVYTLLSMCYEELNDYRGKTWLYQEIMNRFPPDSQEYQFAKQQLGLN